MNVNKNKMATQGNYFVIPASALRATARRACRAVARSAEAGTALSCEQPTIHSKLSFHPLYTEKTMKIWLKFGPTCLIAVILGALLVLAFAPFEIFPLAIIAPAGLLALILPTSPKRAGYIGFWFGIGLFTAGVYWVFISIHSYGDVPTMIAGLVAGLLIAILALFPAAACYATNRYFPTNNMRKMVLAFPAVWLISDWVRSWVVCGFAWLFVGYSQTNSPLRGYAPILSVYGVSLAVLMSSGLLVSAIYHYRQKIFRGLYFDLLYLAIIWVLGALLCLIPWTHKLGEPVTVSLVQGNVPQSIKWSEDYLSLSYERYRSLSAPYWGKSNFIIWPESAIPTTLQEAAGFIQEMDDKAIATKTHLILGIPVERTDKAGKNDGYYNAVVSLGSKKGFYFKRRLVPYGEYVPLEALSAKVLDFMNVPMSNMKPGNYAQTPMSFAGVNIATSICFEITFPELIYTRDPNIGLLLTVTNDAWFNHSIAQAQHLQMAAMRAIELGRPVLFASNDGITAIIDSHGNILAEAPPHVEYVLTGKVQPMVGFTPWMTNSMDPILVIILAFIFLTKREKKTTKTPKPILK